jgi:hypothetical protein
MDTTIKNDSSPKSNVFFGEAFQRVLPEMQALSGEAVIPVTLDVNSAVTAAFGVMPGLSRHRDTIAKELPSFDLGRFDKLKDYTMALSYANTLHGAAIQPPDDFKAMYEEALELRETLRRDVETLIGRGLVATDALKAYTAVVGFKNVAADLQLLAVVLRGSWESIQGSCAIKSPEIEHAFDLAGRIFLAVGAREGQGARVAEAAEVRARAFTLFIRAYDDARRAVSFLHWHEGDADSVAPSLYSGRSTGRKKGEETEAVAAPAPATTPSAPPVAANEASGKARIAEVGPFAQ